MDKKSILSAISKAREVSKKRNFSQSFDLIINLKNLNLKNPAHKVDLFIPLSHPKGKPSKIAALVDEELKTQSKSLFNTTILKADFSKLDKKKLKKLAAEHDFFVAQATIMPQVATIFGKVLGPKGKMPNPKAGCVVPPNANLQVLKERLSKLVYLTTKNELIVRTSIGNESMKDEDIEENIVNLYNALLHSLPQEKNNIKSVLVKLSMGPAVQITDSEPLVRLHEKKSKKQKETSKEEKK